VRRARLLVGWYSPRHGWPPRLAGGPVTVVMPGAGRRGSGGAGRGRSRAGRATSVSVADAELIDRIRGADARAGGPASPADDDR
jgi:hypothetical protein